jgi:hypothetical protein
MISTADMTSTAAADISLEAGLRRWGTVLTPSQFSAAAGGRARLDRRSCREGGRPSFEGAMEWLGGTEEGEAFARWNAAVATPVMGYSPLLSKG